MIPGTEFLDLVLARDCAAEWRQQHVLLVEPGAEIFKVIHQARVTVVVGLRPENSSTS